MDIDEGKSRAEISGAIQWRPGDLAYCYVNPRLSGEVQVVAVLPNGCYLVRKAAGSAPGDFAHEFMVTTRQVSRP